MKPLLTLWFWSQNYKQYLQRPTGTSKANGERDVRSDILNSSKTLCNSRELSATLIELVSVRSDPLNSCKTLCNSRELSATLIELVSVLISMTVDKSFPSHTGNLVYSNARFTALEWFTKRVKTLVDIWKFSFAFSSRLSWLRLRFVKGECQKTINIMLCWWSITFGNLRYHPTSTSIDKDSRKLQSSVGTRMAICPILCIRKHWTTLIKTYKKVVMCLTACGRLVTCCGETYIQHLFPAEACNCSLNQLWVSC